MEENVGAYSLLLWNGRALCDDHHVGGNPIASSKGCTAWHRKEGKKQHRHRDLYDGEDDVIQTERLSWPSCYRYIMLLYYIMITVRENGGDCRPDWSYYWRDECAIRWTDCAYCISRVNATVIYVIREVVAQSAYSNISLCIRPSWTLAYGDHVGFCSTWLTKENIGYCSGKYFPLWFATDPRMCCSMSSYGNIVIFRNNL